jgi:fluoride exporter
MRLLAVLLGGAVGTSLRLGVDALLPSPWSTLVVNAVGSFALGLLVAALWPRVPAWTRAGLGSGVLGSFTTFSAFTVFLVAPDTPLPLALGYAAASVVLAFGAAWAGLRVGRPRRVHA